MVEPGNDFHGQMARRMRSRFDENILLDISFCFAILLIIIGFAGGMGAC